MASRWDRLWMVVACWVVVASSFASFATHAATPPLQGDGAHSDLTLAGKMSNGALPSEKGTPGSPSSSLSSRHSQAEQRDLAAVSASHPSALAPLAHRVAVHPLISSSVCKSLPQTSDHWALTACVATPTSSFNILEVGQTLDSTVTVANNAPGPVTVYINFGSLPTGCNPFNATYTVAAKPATYSLTYLCAPTTPGSYDPIYSVSDTGGVSSSIDYSALTGNPLQVVSDPTATISPSRASTDVGVSVRFTATGSGGVSPYTYAWVVGTALGCGSSLSGSQVNCTPSAPGTFSVSVDISDSNQVNGSGTLTPFTVYSPPTVSITANTPTADSNQSVGFRATAAGGSGGYAYVWSPAGVTCTPSGSTLACVMPATGSARSILIGTSITDSDGGRATTTVNYEVYPDPVLGGPTASPSSGVDVGQSFILTVTLSGGAPGVDTYVWSGLPAGCSSSNAPSTSCTPTAAGSFQIRAKVTDPNGFTNSTAVALAYSVRSPPSASTPTPSFPSVDVGNPVVFSTTASGGTSSYTGYNWSGLPSQGCSGRTAASVTCTFTYAGTFNISVYVTDSGGGVSRQSPSLSFNVFGKPVVTFTNRSSADSGQNVTWNATASGGSGRYTYAWTYPANTLTCGSNSSQDLTCTAPLVARSSTFPVSLTAYDSNGVSAAWSMNLTIYPDLNLSEGPPPPVSLDVGQNLTFWVSVSGGVPGTYSFTWTGLPPGCSSADSAQLSCYPGAPGSYTPGVEVRDANGFRALATLGPFVVHPLPSVTTPVPSSAVADVGQSVTFTTNLMDGSSSYAIYAWSGLPSTGCRDMATATIHCTLNQSGTLDVAVRATDSNGGTSAESAWISYVVYPQLNPGSVAASPAIIDLTQNTKFTLAPTLGSGGYSYAWTLPTGCSSTNSAAVLCTPSVAGTFPVSAQVTDSAGVTLSTSALYFTVFPQPVLSTPLASPRSLTLGSPVTISVTLSGGAPGPITYVWSGLPKGCSSADAPTISCTPAATGQFPVTVNATDVNGLSVSSLTVVVTVNSPPFYASLTSASYLPLILLLLLLLLIFLAILDLRRRRPERAPAEEPAAETLPPERAEIAGPAPQRGEPAGEAVSENVIQSPTQDTSTFTASPSIYRAWTATIKNAEEVPHPKEPAPGTAPSAAEETPSKVAEGEETKVPEGTGTAPTERDSEQEPLPSYGQDKPSVPPSAEVPSEKTPEAKPDAPLPEKKEWDEEEGTKETSPAEPKPAPASGKGSTKKKKWGKKDPARRP